jgi:sorting nexin-4
MADDFSHVSWDNDPRAGSSTTVGDSRNGSDARYGSSATTPQHPEGIADPLDLAGTGGGVLECHVSLPIKENEGTKDVFVSYLVTTNVTLPVLSPHVPQLPPWNED